MWMSELARESPLLALLVSLLIGLPIWLVLYFGFFGGLEHLIKRGIEDPSIPRYDGLSRTKIEPGPPWVDKREEFAEKAPDTARQVDFYRP